MKTNDALVVYGWIDYIRGRQYRAACAARTKAEFRKITGLSAHTVNKWVSETREPGAVAAAMREPGVVMIRSLYDSSAEWERKDSVVVHEDNIVRDEVEA